MQVNMRLEIHFHQQDLASVLIESSTAAEQEPTGELMLFSLFGARMFVNLGEKNPSAHGLAQLFSAVGDADEITELVHHESPDGPRLVGYQGSKGRKGFLAKLDARDDHLGFTVKPWGLGLMARGAGYYSPNAAVLLLRHLAAPREGDGVYMNGLATACQALAEAFQMGQLGVRSQAHVAMTTWAMAAAELPDFEGDD